MLNKIQTTFKSLGPKYACVNNSRLLCALDLYLNYLSADDQVATRKEGSMSYCIQKMIQDSAVVTKER